MAIFLKVIIEDLKDRWRNLDRDMANNRYNL